MQGQDSIPESARGTKTMRNNGGKFNLEQWSKGPKPLGCRYDIKWTNDIHDINDINDSQQVKSSCLACLLKDISCIRFGQRSLSFHQPQGTYQDSRTVGQTRILRKGAKSGLLADKDHLLRPPPARCRPFHNVTTLSYSSLIKQWMAEKEGTLEFSAVSASRKQSKHLNEKFNASKASQSSQLTGSQCTGQTTWQDVEWCTLLD